MTLTIPLIQHTSRLVFIPESEPKGRIPNIFVSSIAGRKTWRM